ncbi:hypothetical protein EI94DRAFT_1806949 [Lactarius quietus]|nr:hypothetical protein EI94DRAFT_1806949 [Lactarius quietus]
MPAAQIHADKQFSIFELVDYPSDEECNEYKDDEDDEDKPSDVDMADVQDELLAISNLEDTQSSESVQTKQRKLDIPVQVQKAWKQEESQKELQADPTPTHKQRKCLHEHWKNCHDYPEAHTWESRAEEDIEEEEAVRALVAAEDDSYLAYDEAYRVRQLMLAGESLQDG